MKDSLSHRIRRIITASVESMVSSFEGAAPESLMRQSIEELDSALDELRAEQGLVTVQKHQVNQAAKRLQLELAELEQQSSVALEKERLDLVEAAAARMVDIEDQLPALQDQLNALDSQEKEFSAAITGMLAKRREMETSLQKFSEQLRQRELAAATGKTASLMPGTSAAARADRAERAFARVLGESDTLSTSANADPSGGDRGKLLELANLSRNARIEAKLLALKAQAGRQH